MSAARRLRSASTRARRGGSDFALGEEPRTRLREIVHGVRNRGELRDRWRRQAMRGIAVCYQPHTFGHAARRRARSGDRAIGEIPDEADERRDKKHGKPDARGCRENGERVALVDSQVRVDRDGADDRDRQRRDRQHEPRVAAATPGQMIPPSDAARRFSLGRARPGPAALMRRESLSP